ncbi:conserved hypothetical protein [Ricinus communis]|uniref:Uncharacterized protein n=1 Tax=Ricinus communis TaxID=3988 RepID=B9RUT6_RICCO|nr:conserved hypothetical protein [Ricinus communis]
MAMKKAAASAICALASSSTSSAFSRHLHKSTVRDIFDTTITHHLMSNALSLFLMLLLYLLISGGDGGVLNFLIICNCDIINHWRVIIYAYLDLL